MTTVDAVLPNAAWPYVAYSIGTELWLGVMVLDSALLLGCIAGASPYSTELKY